MAGPLVLSGTGTDSAHQIICALSIPGAGSLPTSLVALSRKATPVNDAATPTANEFFKNSRRFNRSLFSHITS